LTPKSLTIGDEGCASIISPSAKLNVELAICTIVIITALNLTMTSFPKWWGNTAPAGTLDYKEIAVQRKVANGTMFGTKDVGG
jgi:hypothetical protein